MLGIKALVGRVVVPSLSKVVVPKKSHLFPGRDHLWLEVESPMRSRPILLRSSWRFRVIMQVDIEWPAIVLQFGFVFNLFSFSFDFFKPECSVKTAFWKTWLGMTFMPYFVMFPLLLAYKLAQRIVFTDYVV